MDKLIAVIKREYVERVRTKWFIIMTLLTPLLMFAFGALPTFFLTMKTGGPTRLAIADFTQDAKLYGPMRDALLQARNEEDKQAAAGSAQNLNANQQENAKRAAAEVQFTVQQEMVNGRNEETVRQALNARIAAGQLDGYIILRPGLLAPKTQEKITYYGHNVKDFIVYGEIEHAANDALRSYRLNSLGVDAAKLEEASQKAELSRFQVNEKGETGKEDSGDNFWVVFFLGLLIYMTIIMYGNGVLSAVIEEKGTRISEILFSSVNSFTLMMGKLVGVSLVGLTQYIIWAALFLFFSLFGVNMLAARGMDVTMPHFSGGLFLYLVLYFLIGYFLYASLYALVGSMVTTMQEGTQVSMPITYTLVIGFMVSFSVIRNSDSPLAFWLSLVPLFSPIIMPLRIVSHQPAPWQILLSLVIGFGSVVGVVWLAARVYRVGMLMYGKRATIPEVWRWIRQP